MSEDKLTSEQIEQYRTDPVAFAEEIGGLWLTEPQKEALRAAAPKQEPVTLDEAHELKLDAHTRAVMLRRIASYSAQYPEVLRDVFNPARTTVGVEHGAPGEGETHVVGLFADEPIPGATRGTIDTDDLMEQEQNDLLLFGLCVRDAQGQRVDPRTVKLDAQGRPVLVTDGEESVAATHKRLVQAEEEGNKDTWRKAYAELYARRNGTELAQRLNNPPIVSSGRRVGKSAFMAHVLSFGLPGGMGASRPGFDTVHTTELSPLERSRYPALRPQGRPGYGKASAEKKAKRKAARKARRGNR